jgi:NADPH-dependent 2,4-dienoyl-CoA reductase/sulfur reductase-like enzyme
VDCELRNKDADGPFDVIVVGGGPAGLAAAIAARDTGAHVVVIEREERAGGILKQCIHDGFGLLRFRERLTGPQYACRDLEELHRREIDVYTHAFVHAVDEHPEGKALTLVTPEEGVTEIVGRALVMATGCRERTDRQVFLHGDRPAGIFTAGQAQRLINIEGILPGTEAVILGSGDIGLIMARRLTLEGAHVRGMYEMKNEPSGLPRNVAQCLEDWNVPLHLSTTITDVHGKYRVEAVTVCPVGTDGIPDRSRPTRVTCDTLILSVGLIPENDILIDLGLQPDERTNGPRVDQNRATDSDGVFVCGNALHVYDLVDYVSECGAIAGAGAAAYARSRRGDSTERTAPGRPVVTVASDSAIAYQIPQRLDLSVSAPPVFFFRITERMERGRLEIHDGERVYVSTVLTFLSPSQMVRYPLNDTSWGAIRRNLDAGIGTLGFRLTPVEPQSAKQPSTAQGNDA